MPPRVRGGGTTVAYAMIMRSVVMRMLGNSFVSAQLSANNMATSVDTLGSRIGVGNHGDSPLAELIVHVSKGTEIGADFQLFQIGEAQDDAMIIEDLNLPLALERFHELLDGAVLVEFCQFGDDGALNSRTLQSSPTGAEIRSKMQLERECLPTFTNDALMNVVSHICITSSMGFRKKVYHN